MILKAQIFRATHFVSKLIEVNNISLGLEHKSSTAQGLQKQTH